MKKIFVLLITVCILFTPIYTYSAGEKNYKDLKEYRLLTALNILPDTFSNSKAAISRGEFSYIISQFMGIEAPSVGVTYFRYKSYDQKALFVIN